MLFFGAKKINITEVKGGAYELPQVLNAYVLPQSTLSLFKNQTDGGRSMKYAVDLCCCTPQSHNGAFFDISNFAQIFFFARS